MNANSKQRIVVIEDEDDIRDVIEYNLMRAGYDVSGASDGRAGLDLIRAQRPHLVLLDLMLPELDGVTVCRLVRRDEKLTDTAIIMLTARDSEEAIVKGLSAGADDYITKPFSPSEVLARISAVLRRTTAADDGSDTALDQGQSSEQRERAVEVSGVRVDPARHEVLVEQKLVELTKTELRLLHALLSSPGIVLSRDQLIDRVMGDNAWVSDRTIDVHIRAIRKKLGTHGAVIETIRGVGYKVLENRD